MHPQSSNINTNIIWELITIDQIKIWILKTLHVIHIQIKSEEHCYRPGVPNARAADQYQSVAYEKLGRTAGGERRASQQSFICRSTLFPTARIMAWPIAGSRYRLNHRSHYRLTHHWLALPPDPSLAGITAWTIPTPVQGKTVFQETGPWCQKSWGPLLQTRRVMWRFEQESDLIRFTG